jgi:3-isopropylmalate/(R)-2-methylmalate dehydratase small subunit
VVARLQDLVEGDPGLEVTVDLVERRVTAGDLVAEFALDEHTRWRLMEGLDDIGLTLQRADDVAAFEARRPRWLPTTA